MKLFLKIGMLGIRIQKHIKDTTIGDLIGYMWQLGSNKIMRL